MGAAHKGQGELMAITLTSTTESLAELTRVASSDDWRTSPAKPEDSPATNGDAIPLDNLSPQKFNEVREEQIREHKDAARNALEGEDRELYRAKGSGKLERRIDKVTKNWRTEESLRIAAENRVKELEARLGTAPTPAQTPTQTSNGNGAKPPETQAPSQPQAQREQGRTEAPTPHQQRMAQGRGKYADFDAAIAEAERNGFELPNQESIDVLKKLPNSSDVMYLMAKNPQFREQISANPQQAAELIRRVGGVLQLEGLTSPAAWQSFNARVAELWSNKDFNPRLLLDLPEFLRPAITDEGKHGAEILLHLGRNLDLAREISQMRPDAALKRLGQLSAQITQQAKRERARPPEPVTPVGTSATRGNIPLDQLPPREYNRIRDAQEAARRRR